MALASFQLTDESSSAARFNAQKSVRQWSSQNFLGRTAPGWVSTGELQKGLEH